MAIDRVVLITGATGQQGGAVARALVGKGFTIRAMTRQPESEKAKALAALGIEVIGGDLDDEASLVRAATGAWGVFAVQNTWEAGVEKEEEQGKRMARVAKAAGVQHYVYTSVGSAHRSTGIPHFDNKWRVEQTVRSLEFQSTVILRPVFFMENLLSGMFLQGDKIVTALDPATKLQMVAVSDIGRIGALAFTSADELKGQEIDLAGDELTMPEAAAAMSRGLGRNISYQQVPMAGIRAYSEDVALMLEWFDAVGYNADIVGLGKRFGAMLTFDQWLATQKK